MFVPASAASASKEPSRNNIYKYDAGIWAAPQEAQTSEGRFGQDERDLQDKIFRRLLFTIALALAFIFSRSILPFLNPVRPDQFYPSSIFDFVAACPAVPLR